MAKKQLLKHTRQKHKFSRTNASQASRRKINGNELSVVTFYAYLLCFVDDGCYGLSVRTVWPIKIVCDEIFATFLTVLDENLHPIYFSKEVGTPPLTCQFRNFFCGRASFFGVFRGKNIPLIVPALDCRSDAGSALGTARPGRRLTFLAPLQQLLGMR